MDTLKTDCFLHLTAPSSLFCVRCLFKKFSLYLEGKVLLLMLE